MLLIYFKHKKLELPSKKLERIAFSTRPKIERLMLIVIDKSTHEEHLSQPLQTKKKIKKAVTFLTVYIDIFNVTNSNKNFFFARPFADEAGFIEIKKLPGAYELENFNKENKRKYY